MAKQFKREVVDATEALNNMASIADRVKKGFDEAEAVTQRFAKSLGMVVNNADLSKISGINTVLSSAEKINKQTEQTIILRKKELELAKLNEKVKLSEIQLLNKQATAEAKVVSEQKKSEQQTNKNAQANNNKAKSVKMLTVAEAQLLQQQREAVAKTKAIAQMRNAETGSLQQLEAKMKLVEMAYNRLSLSEQQNEKTGVRYLKSLANVRGELQAQQAMYGKHTLNVGNYASGYNGLSNSVSQLAREMPAFANSMQTGFMAISNNLPIFFDEIGRIKKANIDLASAGEPVKSVFSQVGKSIFSLSSALSIGVTLLTIYGKDIVNFIGDLFKGSDAFSKTAIEAKKLNAQQKRLNEETKKSREYVANESAEYVGYLMKLRATNQGSKERSRIISEINEKYGTTLKNMQDEAKFQSMINGEVLKYIAYKQQEYRVKSLEEKITLNLQMQEQAQVKLNNARKNALHWNSLVETSEADLAGQGTSLLETQENANKAYQDAQSELESLQNHLYSYGYGLLDAEGKMSGFGYKTKESTQNLKEFNVELSKFDVILANIQNYDSEVQLRFDIRTIANQSQLDTISGKFEDFKEGVFNGIEQTGTYVEAELFRILNDEYDLRKKIIEEQNAFEIEQLKDKLATESALRLGEIEKEKNEKLAEINQTEKDLFAEGKLTSEQKALINKAKIDLDRNYQTERKKISDDVVKQERIIDLQLEKSNEQKNKDITQNERERLEAIKDLNNELYESEQKAIDKQKEEREKEEEEEKDRLEKMNDWRSRLIEKSLDALKKASEEREKLIDKEIQASEKLSDALQAQANNGTITAQQSLAEQQKITNQKTLEKQKEQKLQQQLEDIKILYQAVEHYVDKGDTVPVATGKAFLEVKGLKALAGSLKGFFTGTKRTVGEELGAPQIAGKDGHIIRVDGSEKIFNPDQSRATGSATTDDIVDGYLFAKAISQGALNNLSIGGNNSRFDDRVIKQLDSLEQTIRNKPETQFDVNKIGSALIEISGKTKIGNQIIHNRFIVKN